VQKSCDWENTLMESAERWINLALMSRRSAQRLRLSTVPLSVQRQQMGLKDKEVKIQEQKGDKQTIY
jgi:hypothetical protein